jgi:multidrug efflux pump subunit AcrA (membrane-fusion protein)
MPVYLGRTPIKKAMTISDSGRQNESFDHDWDRIDDLLSEIARLSKSEVPTDEFFGRTLEASLQGLGAAGVAFWARDEAARARLIVEKLPNDAWPTGMAAVRKQLIDQVLRSARSGVLPPHCNPSGDAPAGNPTDYVILICPWMMGGQTAGVIEVLQSAGASTEVENGCLKLLEAIGELVADYHRNGQIRELRERLQSAARLEHFSQAIHAQLDLQSTAYAIVNEGRQLLGCDRLSLLIARGSRFRLAAVSGVDTIHPRAKVMELLEKLAAAVAAIDEPLWFPNDGNLQPPQVEEAAGRFLDDSHARALAVLLLKIPAVEGQPVSRPLGVLVVERHYGVLDDRLRLECQRICTTCALAIRNAMELADLPFAGLLRTLRWLKSGSGRRRVAMVAAGVLALTAALILIPADFTITARGELQPQRVHEVFAQADGLIVDLTAEHGKKVQQKDLLARLRSPQMDLTFKQVLGELETTRKRLTSVESERLRIPRDTDEQRRQYDQLTAQATELGEMIRNLEEQRKILLEKQEELEVRSPMRGEVLTWNVRKSLDARPVRRGQILMTIGDLSGPWQLELRIRDRDASHLLTAQEKMGDALDVRYYFNSDPSRILHGTIRRVALRTETPEGQEPSLAAIVELSPEARPQFTAGATVSASIACGRRSLGYVWLHDLFDAVRGWMWF